MNEWQSVGNLLKCTADELKVKPRTREPGGKVSEKSSAYTTDLLIGQNASEEQSKGYEKDRYRYNEEDSKKNVNGYVKSKRKRNEVTNYTLRYRYGDYRKSISKNEIDGGKGRRIKSLQKSALSVFCNERSGKKRHKRQSEHRNAGRKSIYLKHINRNICLYQGLCSLPTYRQS